MAEVGTRSGDGAACFAQVARSFMAMEADPKWCEKLSRRLKAGNVTIVCKKYQEGTPDADVYTWWQESPWLENLEILGHLSKLKADGRIRAWAQAAVLFDEGEAPDRNNLHRLERMPFWHRRLRNESRVPFNEHRACKKAQPHMAAHFRFLKVKGGICARAKGAFVVRVYDL